jgi:hypothetical protein
MSGGGGGKLLVGQQQLTAGADNYLSAAQLAQLTYQAGTGIDTLFVRASDGLKYSAWSTGITVNPPVNNAPVMQVLQATVNLTKAQPTVAVSTLFSATDPDQGDTIVLYDVWMSGSGGGKLLVGQQQLTAGADNYLTAAQLAQLTYQAGTGVDTLFERASDGTVFSAWTSGVTINAPINHAPVVQVTQATVNLTKAQPTVSVSTLFSVTDADQGDVVTQYDVWMSGGGGGKLLVGNQQLTAGADNYLSASQLAQLTYQGGTGADTLFLRANDGTAYSAWSSGVIVNPAVNHAPVVNITQATVNLTRAQPTVAVSSLFNVTDADQGDTPTQYDVWLSGTGGGKLLVGQQQLTTGGDNFLSAAQLAQLTYQAGTSVDTLWVKASDGTAYSAWSNGITLNAPVNHAPTVATNQASVTLGAGVTAMPVSSFFTATDPDQGDTITRYDVWNTGTGGGHFLLGSQSLGVNQDIQLTAAQFAQLTYQPGSGTDTLWLMASDGLAASSWSTGVNVVGTAITSANQPLSVPNGATVTISNAYNGTVTFGGSTGTLVLANASNFTGTVAGLSGQDTIDLTNITFSSVQTPSFSGDANGGTLTVTDGTHTDAIKLTGDYTQSGWTTSNDGHGGTNIVDPPLALVASAADAPGTAGGGANLDLLTSYMASLVPSASGTSSGLAGSDSTNTNQHPTLAAAAA